MRKYHFENEANFGLDCHGCGKEIKNLPCIMLGVEDLEEWVYFHKRCFKKFKKENEI